jgi:hypothetical protein
MNFEANQKLIQISSSDEIKERLEKVFEQNRKKQKAFRAEEAKNSPVLNSAYRPLDSKET